MLRILLSIAPIFLLIVLGYGLRRRVFTSVEFWSTADRMVYWLLFPALLFFKTSTIDLSGALVRNFAVVIYCAFGAAVLFALIAARFTSLDQPAATSVLQGAARHNTFIALGAAERLYGSEGLALAALVAALQIPITNITVVTLMVTMLSGRGQKDVVWAVLRDLARNPLLIGVVLGLGVNVLGIAPIPVLHDLAGVLGDAALPIMLLCVGANIRVRAMGAAPAATVLSMVGKMAVFPTTVFFVGQLTGLAGLPLQVALLFGAVPTAASAYTLARQLGGDAPLMASIITLQTAAAFLTLPLTVALTNSLIG